VTRDRLAYSQHCFSTLREFAGCEYDHYVFDNGSEDGTDRWLLNGVFHHISISPKNLGLSQGFNRLLDSLTRDYDVIVKMDNDCALTQPNTLRDVCALTIEGDWLLSPVILGLLNPPQPTRSWLVDGEQILEVRQIGGIFIAAPASFYEGWRTSEHSPHYGFEDGEICSRWQARGGRVGYMARLEAWHHEGTAGQIERYPEYWERKKIELGVR
jgi:GT2 family glycosyltransferase